ncbi:hypothetical protein LCGC14_0595080 [marine sediment metagenome]|uniref:Phosphoadenosine phosphosulphate reductase domain-containing protein n=1 Tax=marine sediment metagenome TaxID=412755 RepID=A0A0F9RH69_9ZZZZ
MKNQLITGAVDTIRAAIDEHKPVKVYALVSGGNDSTVVGHLAATYGPRIDAIVHINTGIGIEATREYVRDFTAGLGLQLIEKHAARSYEDLVLEFGFPGPGAHRYMYSWLKERSLREVRREAQSGGNGRVMFITGVRLAESRRRMGSVQAVQRDGNTVWVAPILEFESSDMWQYREDHQLVDNEVVALLHMSGECLCGAFARPNELAEIRQWFPDVAGRISRLEKLAHAAGVVSSHWGPQSSKAIRESVGMLCSGCELVEDPE